MNTRLNAGNWERKASKSFGLVYPVFGSEEVDVLSNNIPVIVNKTKRQRRKDIAVREVVKGDVLSALTGLLGQHERGFDLIRLRPSSIAFDVEKEKELLETGNGEFLRGCWLSCVRPILEVAWRLLRSRGVLLIESGGIEHAYLHVLAEEVFGFQRLDDKNMGVSMKADGSLNYYYVYEKRDLIAGIVTFEGEPEWEVGLRDMAKKKILDVCPPVETDRSWSIPGEVEFSPILSKMSDSGETTREYFAIIPYNQDHWLLEISQKVSEIVLVSTMDRLELPSIELVDSDLIEDIVGATGGSKAAAKRVLGAWRSVMRRVGERSRRV